MAWVIFNERDEYLGADTTRHQWTMMLRRAARFNTREAAEDVAAETKCGRSKLFVLEVTSDEVFGKHQEQKYKSWLPFVQAMEEGKEMTEEEKAELPARILAVRLIFGDRMPPGVKNPHYFGANISKRNDTVLRKSVDRLAARIIAGEDVRPRDEHGNPVLPLPRRQIVSDDAHIVRLMTRSPNMTRQTIRKPTGRTA